MPIFPSDVVPLEGLPVLILVIASVLAFMVADAAAPALGSLLAIAAFCLLFPLLAVTILPFAVFLVVVGLIWWPIGCCIAARRERQQVRQGFLELDRRTCSHWGTGTLALSERKRRPVPSALAHRY